MRPAILMTHLCHRNVDDSHRFSSPKNLNLYKDKVVNASSGNRRGYSDLEKGNKQADQAVEDETDYSYEEDQARVPWTVRPSKNYGTNRS